MQNLIFLGAGILILLIFFFSIVVIRLRGMRDSINLEWYNLLDKLQYRQDMIPNLIETVRVFTDKEVLKNHSTMIKDLIEKRSEAARNERPGAEKIIVEHELSKLIYGIFEIENKSADLKQSTNYLELKREFNEIRKELDNLTADYNNKVRNHNKVRKRIYNFIPAVLLGYKKKKIFDFE